MAKAVHHGITVDLDRDQLFDTLGLQRLKESYMKDEEDSPQERFAYVSNMFASNEEHAQRLYEYSSKHWLSYSTPILSYGRSKKGMPISCFLNYINDTAEGLVENLSETAFKVLFTFFFKCFSISSLLLAYSVSGFVLEFSLHTLLEKP